MLTLRRLEKAVHAGSHDGDQRLSVHHLLVVVVARMSIRDARGLVVQRLSPGVTILPCVLGRVGRLHMLGTILQNRRVSILRGSGDPPPRGVILAAAATRA
jgi:hypothetical protein